MLLRDTIREVMRKLDYDATEMALKLGVSSNTVWRYLAGTVAPSAECLARLSAIGKLDYKELLVMKSTEQQAGRATRRAMAEPLPNKPSVRPAQHPRSNTAAQRRAAERERAEMKQMAEFMELMIGKMKSLEAKIDRLEDRTPTGRFIPKKA